MKKRQKELKLFRARWMETELRSPNIQRNLSEPQRGSERLVFTSTRKKILNGPKL